MNPIAMSLALLISFLWGLSPVLHKHVLTNIHPKTVLVVSSVIYMICTVVYFIVYRNIIVPDVRNLDRKSLLFIAITAILCGFFTNILYFHILKRYESHIVSALIYSSPVFTLLIAFFFLKEKITPIGFFGVVFIVMGVVMLAFNKPGAEPFLP
jgi:uncharacterized membrane protein